MQDVTITFTAGPMQGIESEFEIGKLLIGRLPGPDGLELKQADQSVSRVHAELIEEKGKISLLNHSPNGTTVGGKLVQETVLISPGVVVQVGDRHSFEIQWTSFTDVTPQSSAGKAQQKPVSQGALASPLVRTLIAVYLLAMVGLVIWATDTDSGANALDEWPVVAAQYEAYKPEGVAPEILAARAARAEVLMRELRAMRAQGRVDEVERACRELMGLDGDIVSPLFKYGAACLGSRY